MRRALRNYQRPKVVDEHMASAAYYNNIGKILDHDVVLVHAAEKYAACAELLDNVVRELFKMSERYHVVVDQHGPLYHVEVIDFIAKIETIMEKVNQSE